MHLIGSGAGGGEDGSDSHPSGVHQGWPASWYLPRIRSSVLSVSSPCRLAALQEYRPWSKEDTAVSTKEPSCREGGEPSLLLFLNQVTSASGTPRRKKKKKKKNQQQKKTARQPPHSGNLEIFIASWWTRPWAALQEASAWASSTLLRPN